MSHKLYRRANGEYAFASTQKEWHALGKIKDGPMTPPEALEATGMDNMELIEAEASAIITRGSHRLSIPMDGYKAIVLHDRDTDEHRAIGPVGEKRLITQFPDVVEPLHMLMDQSGGTIETFGLLEPGGEWFASVKMPKDVTIGGDKHYPYVWATDGLWSSYKCAPVMTRVCCANTNAAAMMEIIKRGMAYTYVMQHRAGAKIDVEAIRAVIGMTYTMADELDTVSRVLLDQAFVDAQFKAMTDNLFGVPKADPLTGKPNPAVVSKYKLRTRKLDMLFNDSDNPTLATTWRDGGQTKWTAFQAVSEYVDWMSPVRGNQTARRLERVMDTSVQVIKAQALEALL